MRCDDVISGYVLDTTDVDACGNAMIYCKDKLALEMEFNLDATVSIDRTFKGKAGTHQWRVYKEIDIVGKLYVEEGDYVVVLGTKNTKYTSKIQSITNIRRGRLESFWFTLCYSVSLIYYIYSLNRHKYLSHDSHINSEIILTSIPYITHFNWILSSRLLTFLMIIDRLKF